MFNNVDVYMMCVAANQQVTLTNAPNWLMQIRQMNDTKPIILTLTKSQFQSNGEVEDYITDEQLKNTRDT